MKRAVVFGGAGFLGSHVAEELLKNGYQVTVFDKEKTPFIPKGATFIKGDILNARAVAKAVPPKSIVYNFAAIMSIKTCSEEPAAAITVNVLGNINVLEACVKAKCEKFVYASSLYVNSKQGSFYRISKHASEMIVEEYSRQYGLPYVILRYGSLYGPRADARNGVYRFIREGLRRGAVKHFGSIRDTRAFVHVRDSARASVEILKRNYANSIYLITGPQELRVIDVIASIGTLLKKRLKVEFMSSTLNYGASPFSYEFRKGKVFSTKGFVKIQKALPSLIEEAQTRKS